MSSQLFTKLCLIGKKLIGKQIPEQKILEKKIPEQKISGKETLKKKNFFALQPGSIFFKFFQGIRSIISSQDKCSSAHSRPQYNKFLQLTLLLGTLFLPVLALGLAWTLTHITPKKREAYHQLMDKAEYRKTNEKFNTHSTQERESVRKDFWFMQKGERLHLKILAKHSTLALESENEHMQVVEHMQNVICLMQEQLYYLLSDGREATLQNNGQLLIKNTDTEESSSWLIKETQGIRPMQLIRYMTAKEATYFYENEQFSGNDVQISTYAFPGHELNDKMIFSKPLMQGVAKKVEFSFFNHELNFKAYQMKASFFSHSQVKEVL